MIVRYFIYYFSFLTLLAVSSTQAIVPVDDVYVPKYKGITVNVEPIDYYSAAAHNSALFKVLKQAQRLTTLAPQQDGVPYKQHSWNANSDKANLKKGIDCSRVIWFVFTRAGLPYNPDDQYLHTAIMWQPSSKMRHEFDRCDIKNLRNLRLGDVLVYRGGGKGHTVMVLDPQKKYAWGSHGWDGSGKKDTGVEVQRVYPDSWRYWDKRSMKLKACWRYKQFSTVNESNNLIATGIFPETKNRRLSSSDLQDRTKRVLWLMRNEMFARYGYRFENQQLERYFKKQPWYLAYRDDSRMIYSKKFSQLEKENAVFIYRYEQNLLHSGYDKMAFGCDYPTKRHHRLTKQALRNKSKHDLWLMRNMIFAYHGYKFNNEFLRFYFSQCDWYRPQTQSAGELYTYRFSQIERDNITLIREFE